MGPPRQLPMNMQTLIIISVNCYANYFVSYVFLICRHVSYLAVNCYWYFGFLLLRSRAVLYPHRTWALHLRLLCAGALTKRCYLVHACINICHWIPYHCQKRLWIFFFFPLVQTQICPGVSKLSGPWFCFLFVCHRIWWLMSILCLKTTPSYQLRKVERNHNHVVLFSTYCASVDSPHRLFSLYVCHPDPRRLLAGTLWLQELVKNWI